MIGVGALHIVDAQREVRTVYLGGFVGQIVSSLIWFASATIATAVDPKTGFWALAIGGMAIFPLTQGLLRLGGRPGSVSRENPLGQLGAQVAFTIPLVLPLAGIAAIVHPGWFYPACLVIVGAHYLPFIFLYGMKTFAVLAGALVAAGFALGILAPGAVISGGWVGGGLLFGFAFVLLAAFQCGEKGMVSHPV